LKINIRTHYITEDRRQSLHSAALFAFESLNLATEHIRNEEDLGEAVKGFLSPNLPVTYI
jgi:hypothetical protein